MKQTLFTLRRGLLALALGLLSTVAQAHCSSAPDDFNAIGFGPIMDNDAAPGGFLAARELTLHITCNKDGQGRDLPKTLNFGTDFSTLPGTDLWRTNLPGLAMRVTQDGKVISNLNDGIFMQHPGDGSTSNVRLLVTLIRTGVITPGHVQGLILRVDAAPAGGEVGHNIGSLHVINTYVHGVACNVNTDSKNLVVDFGEVPAAGFTGPGSTPVTRNFEIGLNCSGYGDGHPTPMSIRFVGAASADNPDVLKLSGPNAATGIGIRILKDNAPLPLNTWNSLGNVNSWDMRLPLTAQYYQVASQVTPGGGNAALTFLIDMR
ncbi:fimbrial protein [Paraherbaspirillum soli]|uniref:Fimbrial protein n=1 Tax=Paraherbaspirillum soli TaxID=631222 RepID=A0ABW0MH90_9BURK